MLLLEIMVGLGFIAFIFLAIALAIPKSEENNDETFWYGPIKLFFFVLTLLVGVFMSFIMFTSTQITELKVYDNASNLMGSHVKNESLSGPIQENLGVFFTVNMWVVILIFLLVLALVVYKIGSNMRKAYMKKKGFMVD